MARLEGTKNRFTEAGRRLAEQLTGEIKWRSGGLSDRLIVEHLLGDRSARTRRRWNRWRRGEIAISDAYFHLIAHAAIAKRWLDASSPVLANYSPVIAEEARKRNAKQHDVKQRDERQLESTKAMLDEVKAFTRAKRALLASLEKYETACLNLKLSEPIDVGDADLRQMLEDLDHLNFHQREKVRRLEAEAVFSPFPSPTSLISQLTRQELYFLELRSLSPIPRESALRRHRKEAPVDPPSPDAPNDGELHLPSGQEVFRELARQSERRAKLDRDARIKKLQALAHKAKW